MSYDQADNQFDVIIVGGSYAGLSAVMPLARARRRVLVIDAGQRRNRYATHSHGFLTQDGSEGAAIAAAGKAQVLAYPSVTWLDGRAATAAALKTDTMSDGFSITMEDGAMFQARRLVLAIGMVDVLPQIDGLAERWGQGVFPCPYCDGYELQQGRIGVLASGPMSMHQAMMLPDWGPTTFFLNGAFTPDDAQLAALAQRGVTVEPTPLARIEGKVDVVLQDGRSLPLAGLFVASRPHLSSPLADQLGCAMEAGPLGPYLRTDAMKATTVAGVYGCGDAARMAASVPFAVADGMQAGVSAHQSLFLGAVAAA